MLKRKKRQDLRELRDPGDREEFYGTPGSIEQQLDMCERDDEMRGDEVIRSVNGVRQEPGEDPVDLSDLMESNYRMDLSDEDREGDEMSGDDHSSGLQGGEHEIPNRKIRRRAG